MNLVTKVVEEAIIAAIGRIVPNKQALQRIAHDAACRVKVELEWLDRWEGRS